MMKDGIHDQLTILVPTHNRPAFLRRLLTFIEWSEIPLRLLVADSSQPNLYSENSATIDRLSKTFRIDHWRTDLGIISKCRVALESIDTPFVVCCADDDFLMIESLAGHVEFLSDHPDYSCSQGILASVNARRPRELLAIPSFHLVSQNPLIRFAEMQHRWFTTFYAVYHTEILRRAFQITDMHCDWQRARIFPEILLSQLCVLAGRVNFQAEVYMIREEHDLNESVVVPEILNVDTAAESYCRFREALGAEVVRVTGVSIDRALEVVDAAYGHLRYGDQKSAKKRRTLGQRISRELQRLSARIWSPFQRDCIPFRRRLKSRDVSEQKRSFDLARDLFESYPTGMSAAQFEAYISDGRGALRADCA